MTSLDRQAQCPSCGAPMTFKFAGARAQVCKFCKFVVARTDRGLQATGRMAELLEIPTPLQLGVIGNWHGEPFAVEGRVQMDRAGAPGAPWQEILIGFPRSGKMTWVAYAQGRWYAMDGVDWAGVYPPAPQSLRPGGTVDLGHYGQWVVAEVGQRRVVAGEGELSNVPKPGVITPYADISAPGGRFGTIDYGDGTEAPTLYLGQQFDPATMKLDSGMPLELPEAKVSHVECPNCGGDLPLLSGTAERIVCRYCGTASDVTQGALSALGPAPKPPIEPFIPIGAEGVLRGHKMVCTGFVIRSTRVDGVVYSWREYLLYGGSSVGYQWLMEEDGNWTHVLPVEAGEVVDAGNSAQHRGVGYGFKQQVTATVDYVIGEFYWKVEIGEAVEATDFEGPGGKISRERTRTEVNYSLVTPLSPDELRAFGVAPPMGAAMGLSSGGSSGGGCAQSAGWIIAIVIILVICVVISGGSSGGSGVYYGGSSLGK